MGALVFTAAPSVCEIDTLYPWATKADLFIKKINKY